MANWSIIENSPDYQAKTDAEKEVVKREYFNEFIVSDPEFARFPKEQRDHLFNQFVMEGKTFNADNRRDWKTGRIS
jgi:hypothetical protein